MKATLGSAFFDRLTSVLAVAALLLATLLLFTKGLDFAADFTGGMIIEVHYPEAVGVKSVQESSVRAGLTDASVKAVSSDPSYFFIVLPTGQDDPTPDVDRRLAKQVVSALDKEQRHIEVSRIEVVTKQMGREVLVLGVIPLVLACVIITIYPAVRHGWRFALAVGLPSIRNVAIVLGILLSAHMVFELEFSLASLLVMNFLAILVAGVSALFFGARAKEANYGAQLRI